MDLSPLAALQSVHERRKAACRVFNSRIPLSSPQPPRFFSLKFAQWETLARYSCSIQGLSHLNELCPSPRRVASP
ncbi:hypothetical protein BFJ63_vAg9659 [Fusarium oxysporum f. sp. narcissi]|uniref:Uncharacterized protein n=6 Tax=Fusarium oxysporum TaxID=5507 RepID=A0A420T9V8_FUSOX|nr:hypothetical protein HZS61_001278 [Fusarium oxysporum f. sp. conglutinans]KAG7438095.1 hypothetical protein Forpi1262_v000608 [Fusarium oxysporum f. sp. raphani]KAK2487694.1 hypothetical protein H9L39_01621 [Fusarium oxysporum f. sp. albedinis]RKK28121.1 hypothetical protein BFJ65_g74 [Fusarium oxysporum f. sp. cepae]RKK71900.1 hypothetical protein BFJ69_g10544 [Fusarium oxysporum]RYC87496.1 hypothetical protein BFJ63_vAg9659 [Fusarium oxysporum f. sp. narcissi]TVY70971.1 hypothetical prot